MNKLTYVLLAAFLMLLAACGGSSESNKSEMKEKDAFLTYVSEVYKPENISPVVPRNIRAERDLSLKVDFQVSPGYTYDVVDVYPTYVKIPLPDGVEGWMYIEDSSEDIIYTNDQSIVLLKGDMNVRNYPYARSEFLGEKVEIIGTAKQYEKYKVLSVFTPWIKVKNAAGLEGWMIYNDYYSNNLFPEEFQPEEAMDVFEQYEKEQAEEEASDTTEEAEASAE